MLLETALVDELLGGNVTGGEEHGGGDALSEEGARGEAAVVPIWCRQRSEVFERMGKGVGHTIGEVRQP